MTKEPLGVCEWKFHQGLGPHTKYPGCEGWRSVRPVDAGAPAAPPREDFASMMYTPEECAHVPEFGKPPVKDQTHAAIDEAVRVVDRMTCSGCEKGYPLKKGWHDTWDDGSIHMLCSRQGRAILDALVKLGWRKE